MPNYLYNKDLEDTQEALDDIKKFKNYKINNIKLYQFFKALTTHTQNKYAIKIKDFNNLNNKELNYNYNWSTY